ncbi:uncharacterized protein MELLADRAFT_60296 [Melampsora larici-populina 98AG31]|uniref:Uncharacterized protein n=1 Tax=Melampsora larici-populina (strain 98AG31 / pathotype 3-4-7) TaxID=747676 RepID=F4RAT7_MELLP|nr:uncharacterized protein MELLADRAFT_60296 [Melampsora larici-populina 98AG31]EGG10721.1 hypothetical protein MELLADRAFT_60296 [Melampsora larici-populina 98AG31]
MATKLHLHLLLLKVIVLHGFFTLYSCMNIPRNTLSLFPEVPTSTAWTDRAPELSPSVLESITDVNGETKKQPAQLFSVSEEGVNEEKSPPLNVLELSIESERSPPYHPTTSACSANSKMQMKESLGPSYIEVVNFVTPSERDSVVSSRKLIFQIIKRFEIFSNPEQTNQARNFWTLEKILPFMYFTQFQKPTSEVWKRCIMITSLVFYAYYEKHISTGHDIDYNLLAEFLRWYTETLYYILHPSLKGLTTQQKAPSQVGKKEPGYHMDSIAVLFLEVHDDCFYQRMFSRSTWHQRYPIAQKIVSQFSEDKLRWIHDGTESQLFNGSNPWEEWIDTSGKILASFSTYPWGTDVKKKVIGLGNEHQVNPVSSEFNDLWKNWSPFLTNFKSYQLAIASKDSYQLAHEITYFLKDQCASLKSQVVQSKISNFSTSISLFLQIKGLHISHEYQKKFKIGYSRYKSSRKSDAKCYNKRKAREASKALTGAPEASPTVLESITDVNAETKKQPTHLFSVSGQAVNEENAPPLTVSGLNIESERSPPYHSTTSVCSANSKIQMEEILGPSYIEVVNFVTPSEKESVASSMKMISQIIKRFEIFSNPEETNQARNFWTLEKILPFMYFTQFQKPTSEVWKRCIMITSLVFYAYHEKYILTGQAIDYDLLAEFLRWYTETLYYILHPSFKGLATQQKDPSGFGKKEEGCHMDSLAVVFLEVHDDCFYHKRFCSRNWQERYSIAQKIVSQFSEDQLKLIHGGTKSQLFNGSNPWEEWIDISGKILASFSTYPLGKDVQKKVIGLGNEHQINQVASEFNDLWKNWSPYMTNFKSYQLAITSKDFYQFAHELTYFLKDQCASLRSLVVQSNISNLSTSIGLFLQMKGLHINHEYHEKFMIGYSKYKSSRKIGAKCYNKRKAREETELEVRKKPNRI